MLNELNHLIEDVKIEHSRAQDAAQAAWQRQDREEHSFQTDMANRYAGVLDHLKKARNLL